MTVVPFINRQFEEQWRELTLLRDAQAGLDAAKAELDDRAEDLIERIAERFPNEFRSALDASVSPEAIENALANADTVCRSVMPAALSAHNRLLNHG